jgi:hypothetical protein
MHPSTPTVIFLENMSCAKHRHAEILEYLAILEQTRKDDLVKIEEGLDLHLTPKVALPAKELDKMFHGLL